MILSSTGCGRLDTEPGILRIQGLAQGKSWDDLLKGYPELKKDDIKAALLYVRASLDHTKVKAANA